MIQDQMLWNILLWSFFFGFVKVFPNCFSALLSLWDSLKDQVIPVDVQRILKQQHAVCVNKHN